MAIAIPAEVRAKLVSMIGELRLLAPQMKWVRAENLHLTLRFIGETDTAKLDGIRAALAGIRASQPIALLAQGLGFFPNEKRPRVLWAGISAVSGGLPELAAEIDASLAPLGFASERRPFQPHLTLARIETARLPNALSAATTQYSKRSFGAWRATEFHLIESKLKSTGAEYTTLQSFRFVSENSASES